VTEATGRRTSIDPRIRARRIAVQRDVGRQRLRRLLLTLGAAAVVAAAWGTTRSPLLDVDHVEVTGATNSGDGAVRSASGIEPGSVLLTVPLGRAAERIAALPWVQTVDVERQWPGTVAITVTERRPIAYLPASAGVVLVDGEARQLARLDAPPPGLLRLDVPPVRPRPGEPAPGKFRAVLDLAATLPSVLADRIVALRPEPDGSVSGTVLLRDGGQAALLLGTPTQAGAKWLALATILEEADPARLATIDLRVPGAPALTRR
jgi:cell division protein FtsQ